MVKISTFDDWIDYFRQWQKDIGYDPALLSDYKFETKLGELHSPEIEFGDFKGQPKWQRVTPDSQSIHTRCLDESDRLPGRYRIRLGRAAEKSSRYRAD